MTIRNLLNPTENDLCDNLTDITYPQGPVEVSWNDDASVLWINIGGICVVRINGLKSDQLTIPLRVGAKIPGPITKPRREESDN
jgi:hypothetical protein